MNCLNLSKLIAYNSGALATTEQERIDRHLDSCAKCGDKLRTYRHFKRFLKGNFPPHKRTDHTQCYDEVELVSFLGSKFRRTERKDLFVHLRHCDSCLDNLLGIESLVTELKRENLVPVQKGFLVHIGEMIATLTNAALGKLQSAIDALSLPKSAYRWLGFAALVIVAGLIFRPYDQVVNISLINRETAVGEAPIRVQLLTPANRSAVHERYPEFRWTGPMQVQSYIFLLLDGNGEIVWEQQTSETNISLPKEIQLQPATTYFWQVEGLWPDEGAIVSEMASFTANRK